MTGSHPLTAEYMSDEKPTQDQIPVEESKETTEQPPAEQTTEESPKSSEDAYFEKQIEELTSRLSEKETQNKGLEQALFEQREKRRKDKDEETTPEPAAEVNEDKILELVSKATDAKYNEMRVDMATSIFEEELEKVSRNDKEKQLIKMHYRSSIKPSGFDRASIRKDLLLSKAAGNIDRVKLSTDAGDISLTTVMSGGGGKMAGAVTSPTVDVSPEEELFLKRYGSSVEEYAKKSRS
jgi:hypothetical protein